MTFFKPEVSYFPYVSQKVMEPVYVLIQYKETYDWAPIITLSKLRVTSLQTSRKIVAERPSILFNFFVSSS